MAEESQIRVITHEFPPRIGGIGTYVVEMARVCAGLGHPVEVWGPRDSREREDGEHRVRIHRMPTSHGQGWWNLWRLHRHLRAHRETFRAGALWLAEPAPIRALALYGHDWLDPEQTLWVTLHGSEMAQFRGHPFWDKRVRALLERAGRIALVSKAMVAEFLDWCPEMVDRVRLTRCALRTDFRPDIREWTEPEPGSKFRVFTVARLHPRKGQDMVVRALALLPREWKERVCYEIVGGGRAGYWEQLRREAATSGVEVIFSGPLHGEDLAAAYRRGDLFVLPSKEDPRSIESFGMAYLEASAWGKPVIGTRVGGVAEAVAEGRTGLLVPPGNVEALSEAILSLLQEPDRVRAMGAEGPAWVSGFSWEESARELLR